MSSRIEKLSHYAVMVIALSALFVSIWQGRVYIKHNKLSVRPFLDSSIIGNDSTTIISFSNEGLGPAIIKKMSYQHEGKNYESLYELIHKIGLQDEMLSVYNYGKNTVLASGVRKPLIEIRGHKLRNIEVNIDFESIYKEKNNIQFSF